LEWAARIVAVVDPHELAPHGIHGYLDGNQCKQDTPMNYVEYLALAVFGRTVADTIHGCKKYENLHSFLPVRCKRHYT
jgi:hypothetical protein